MLVDQNGILVDDKQIIKPKVRGLLIGIENFTMLDLEDIYCALNHNNRIFLRFLRDIGLDLSYDDAVRLIKDIKFNHFNGDA